MIRGCSPWERDEHEHPNIRDPEQSLGTNPKENIFTGLTHYEDKPFLDGDPGAVSCEEVGIFILRKHAFQPKPSLFPGSRKPQALRKAYPIDGQALLFRLTGQGAPTCQD